MVNRIKHFKFNKREHVFDMQAAARDLIDAQDKVITEYRWHLFVARRNARIWFWLLMATVVIHVVSLFI